MSPNPAIDSAEGTDDVAITGTPACCARSRATLVASHVGDRSSINDSSCSSITTIALNRGHGANTADRAPITTSTPPSALSHSSGTTAVEKPLRRNAAAPMLAIRCVGHTTSTGARTATAFTTLSADCVGGTVSSPPPCSINRYVAIATTSDASGLISPIRECTIR